MLLSGMTCEIPGAKKPDPLSSAAPYITSASSATIELLRSKCLLASNKNFFDLQREIF